MTKSPDVVWCGFNNWKNNSKIIFFKSFSMSKYNLLGACNILTLNRELLEGETEGLLKLPTDKALLDDPVFRCFVELYAKVLCCFSNRCKNG